MFNKERFVAQFKYSLSWFRARYQDFRLYDLGSYTLNRLTSRRGYQLQQHIAYGLKSRQRFDLFKTDHPRPQRPCLVFVHGGAWMHGDKKDYRFIGEAFAKEGFDVVLINYHLAPDHIFPAFIDDLHLALNYLSQHSQKLGISMQNVILMGHSAGAFNVMSVLYHPSLYRLTCKAQIQAVIGLAGPYHFDYFGDPLCEEAFDQSVSYKKVMPYYFVEKNHIRHYLFKAENDQIVGEVNADDFDRMLKEKGNHSQILTVPKVGHITILGSVASLFERYFQTKKMILKVLDETLEQHSSL